MGRGDTPMHIMLYVYLYIRNIFSLLCINKKCVFLFFIFFFLCDEISNIRNRILTNQKTE